MATQDVKIVDMGGHNVVPTLKYRTEAGATAIAVGEPLKVGGTGGAYAVPVATEEPVIGVTTGMLGIAASEGSHTASADGYVEVYMPLPGVVYSCKASTPANVDTAAEIDALLHNAVGFDLAAGVYTLDENDGVADGLSVVGGNPDTQEMLFMIRGAAKHDA